MVANETGLTDLTLETIWNVYDTLFCEVSLLRVPSVTLSSYTQQAQVTRTWRAQCLTTIPTGEVQPSRLLLVKQGNFPQG